MQVSNILSRHVPSKLSSFQLARVNPTQLKGASFRRSFGDQPVQKQNGNQNKPEEIKQNANQNKPEENTNQTSSEIARQRHRDWHRRRHDNWWDSDSFSLAPRGIFDSFFGRDPVREFDNIAKSIFGDVVGKRAAVNKDIFQWRPKADMKETKDSFIIQADLPGLSKENLKVEINQDTLTLRGEKKFEAVNGEEGEEFYSRERSYGSFLRRFQLPEGANAKGIKAQFNDGVLKLEIPKTEQSKEAINVTIE